jgi:outer membrane protein assembly factor BamD (BamD/ComL family)
MTRDLQKRVLFSLGMFLILFLSSCGWMKKEQLQEGQLQKEQLQKEQGGKQEARKQTDYVYEYARKEIDVGNFQDAINLYKEVYQRWPQGPNVRSSYIKAIELIKSKGDQAFGRNDFKLAEKTYEILVRNWIYFSDFSQSFSFEKTFLEKRIKTSRCLFAEDQVSYHLKAGEFRKAIDLCKEVYKRYPQDPTVRKGYIQTLESIKTNGDRAFERRDFALAGGVYEMVLRNASSVNHLNGSLSFSKEGLTEKIDKCRKVLFENGLKQYRSGNLDQAISLWKSILAFDPENREIKKAVNMATLQLENLQKTR